MRLCNCIASCSMKGVKFVQFVKNITRLGQRKDSKLKTALLSLKPAPVEELRKEAKEFEELMLNRRANK